MSLFTIIRKQGNTVEGVHHSDDFYDAQLILHQVSEEYATERAAQALDAAKESTMLTQLLKDLLVKNKLCYAVDASKDGEYRTQVFRTPVTPNGLLRESYRVDAPVLDTEFFMVWTDSWDREYFNFLDWSSHHSVTLFTNGTRQQRQEAIKACLSECAVETDWDADCSDPEDDDADDESLESKPEPDDDDDYQPIIVALTEESKAWESFCHHVEPYSDLAITKILDEQYTWKQQGEALDDVVIILEASTPHMLSNAKVKELCETCTDLQMTVLLSVPLDVNSKLSDAVAYNIHYIFGINGQDEKAYQPGDSFEEWAVYDIDAVTYKINQAAINTSE